jgi:hypothetical protein
LQAVSGVWARSRQKRLVKPKGITLKSWLLNKQFMGGILETFDLDSLLVDLNLDNLVMDLDLSSLVVDLDLDSLLVLPELFF